jgi:hypothetical protein
MSLLDRGPHTVRVFPAEPFTDEDGNTIYRTSSTPYTINDCVVQVALQSGTSFRRAEQDDIGYETEDNYRLRPPRYFEGELSSNDVVEWQGERFHVFGNVKRYTHSRRTGHQDYILRRS